MKTIILHNHKEDMTYLVPVDSINYIVAFENVTRIILKYEVCGVSFMDVDESVYNISNFINNK